MSGNPTVVFPGPREVAVESRPRPRPRPGEVLIRSRASLVSTGTEMTVLGGPENVGAAWRSLCRYPYVAGYSNVGEVQEVGDGVEAAWIGRRVSSHTPHAAWTTCAADELRRVPDAVDPAAAAVTTLAEVVMNGLRRAEITWGETVAVVGLGLLGHLATRLCRLAGASKILCIDPTADRLERLPDDPALVSLPGTAAEMREAVLEATGGRGVDAVVEASGNPAAIPQEARLLRPQGRLLLLSSPVGASTFDFHDLCNRNSSTLVGAHYFSHPPRATYGEPWSARRHGELFLEYLQRNDLRVDDLLTHRFPGPEAAEAYTLLGERRTEALGVLLTWNGAAAGEGG